MSSSSAVIIYSKRMEAMMDFYAKYFGYKALEYPDDRIVEMISNDYDLRLMLHPAAKSQKEGQALIKLSFSVKNVPIIWAQCKKDGLAFGSIHKAVGYEFANAKDPSGNSIQISSRAYRD